ELIHALSELKKTEFKRRMAVHLSLVLLQIIVLQLRPIKASERFPCPTECGNISISYPFGIGKRCYFNKGYEVICDYSSGSPKAFLPGVNRLELLDILPYPKFAVRVNVPTISLNGISEQAILLKASSVFDGCLSICTCDPTLYPACYDFLFALPRNITHLFNVNTSYLFSQSIPQKCQSVFLVDEHWVNSKYLEDPHDLKDQQEVPAVLKWGEKKGSCFEEYNSYSTFCNLNKIDCLKQLSSDHLCLCSSGYDLEKGYCSGDLICNISSGYDCSNCPDGPSYFL
ncbi:hypothetical protein CUMW_177690, partial [Citrus unshiu]